MRRATTWPRPRAGTAYPRPPRITNPFYTAGWVRSCLQDESGRTNRACDWPARTCNASGSRADCAVSRRLPGQSRASLPAREEPLRMRRTRFSAIVSLSPACLLACLPAFPLSALFPPVFPSFTTLYALASPIGLSESALVDPAADPATHPLFPVLPNRRRLSFVPRSSSPLFRSHSLSTSPDDDRASPTLLVLALRFHCGTGAL